MTRQHNGALHVSGEGQIKVKPDVAWIHLTTITDAKTATEAVADNAARMGQVIERVRALGLPPEAMRTVGLHLYPLFSYEEGPDKGKIVGYRAEDTIRIEAAVELAGKIFDEGIAAGANQSSSLSFGLREEAAYRDKALAAAVAAARRDAEIVSGAMGLRVLGAREVQIDPSGARIALRDASRVEMKATTPVLPGELTISARVSIVYDCG